LTRKGDREMTVLTIRFTGLCLFVPSPKEKVAYVLLPHTPNKPPAAAGMDNSHHSARLVFDTVYLREPDPKQTEKDGVLAHVPLTGRRLTLPAKQTGVVTSGVDPAILDLSPLAQSALKKGVLELDPDKHLTAQVLLTAGNLGNEIFKGGCFDLGPGTTDYHLPNTMDWKIPISDGPLTLQFTELKDRAKIKRLNPPTLYPFLDEIELLLMHVRPSEFPPDADKARIPDDLEPAHHAAFYYDLLEPNMMGKRPIPRFKGETCKKEGVTGPTVGTSSLSCMLARVSG
jgi:hypothetical protein